uniref:Fatty acid--CoA ligase family protein n=1 Tax=Streptomyces sp. NBC_00003 TaxID=2903608 RepID=A0AAU2VCT0_9ACTN
MAEQERGTERSASVGAEAAHPTKLISMLLRPSASVTADNTPFLVDGEQRYTRNQAQQAVACYVERLQAQGARSGHRVLALLDHDARGVFFLAAASALGLRVMMPYNLQTAALPEWYTILTSARPDFVLHLKQDTGNLKALQDAHPHVIELPPGEESAGRRAAALLRAGGNGLPTENFLTLFTSGTTGAPKAISISEELVCQRVASVTAKLQFAPSSRVFMSGLLNNTTGMIFSFGAMLHDATLFFPENRVLEDWPAQVAACGATHIMLRPVALKRFLVGAAASGAGLASLQVVAYGASAMPRSVLEEGRLRIPCAWVQGYGLSETFGPFSWLDEDAHRQQRYRDAVYCLGRPDDTLEVDVFPLEGDPEGIGEIRLRGKAMMEGYCDLASGTIAPPGPWLHTGDLGAWSPDGDLLLKGRISSTLLTADGHRIYPEEIEAALLQVPGIDEAVLVGTVSADTPAELPTACIWGPLSSHALETARQAVAAGLGRLLSREKWPDLLHISPTPFPKSGNDKLLRAAIARQAASAVIAL